MIGKLAQKTSNHNNQGKNSLRSWRSQVRILVYPPIHYLFFGNIDPKITKSPTKNIVPVGIEIKKKPIGSMTQIGSPNA